MHELCIKLGLTLVELAELRDKYPLVYEFHWVAQSEANRLVNERIKSIGK